MGSILCRKWSLRWFYRYSKWTRLWRWLAVCFGVWWSWRGFLSVLLYIKTCHLHRYKSIFHYRYISKRQGGLRIRQPIFERRCPLAAPGNDGVMGRWSNGAMMDFMFSTFYLLWYTLIIHIRSFTHQIKKKEKVLKKYFDARKLRRVRDSLPWIRLSFRGEEAHITGYPPKENTKYPLLGPLVHV